MFTKKRLTSALAAGSLVLAAQAIAESKHHEDEQRQHGAHEHGAASMTIVLDRQQMLVELDSPAMNVLGFEHKAETPEQKTVAADIRERLQRPDGVLSLVGGDCTVSSSNIEMPQLDNEHSVDKHHEDEHKRASHSDIRAHYELECAKPDQLKSMRVKVFETFPGFEAVEVQWIIDGRQGSKRMTAGDSTLAVK